MTKSEYKKLYREYRIQSATYEALCAARKVKLAQLTERRFWDAAERDGTWGKLMVIAQATYGHPEQVMSPMLEWRLKQYRRAQADKRNAWDFESFVAGVA
jgi:hypothetical protein